LGLGATEQCEDGSHSVVLDEPTQGTEWGSPIERQLSVLSVSALEDLFRFVRESKRVGRGN